MSTFTLGDDLFYLLYNFKQAELKSVMALLFTIKITKDKEATIWEEKVKDS
jgi:hypothetical protein